VEQPSAGFELPREGFWQIPWVLNPLGSVLATPDRRSVIFWNVANDTEVFRVTGKSTADVKGMAFSPTAAALRSLGAGWWLSTTWPGDGHSLLGRNPTPKYVLSLAFSPDGRTLITVSNDTVARLWDVETGCEKAALAWGAGQLKAVAFAPDGMRAAASGKKGTIVVWDID